jgi:hypothetical protein
VVPIDTNVEFSLVLHLAVLRAVELDHPVACRTARRDALDGGRRGDAADEAGHAGCVEVVDGRREA